MQWTDQKCVDVMHYTRNSDFHRLYPNQHSDDAIWSQRSKLKHLGWTSALRPTPLPESNPSVSVEIPTMEEIPSFEELFAEMLEDGDRNARWERTQHVWDAEIVVETDHPVGIVWMSDLHIGSEGSDMAALLRDIEEITFAGPDLLRVFIGGDSIDNFILPGLAHVHRDTATMSPARQMAVFRRIVERLLPQLIGVGTGNHDGWTKKMAGIDANLAALAGLPVLHTAEDCYFRFRVGIETYDVWRKHRPVGAGKNNPTGGVVNAFKNGNRPFDIGITEHHHTPSMSMFMGHGEARWALTTGSYKTHDPHAREYGHANSKPGTPVTVLHPFGKEIAAFMSIPQAVRYIASFR